MSITTRSRGFDRRGRWRDERFGLVTGLGTASGADTGAAIVQPIGDAAAEYIAMIGLAVAGSYLRMVKVAVETRDRLCASSVARAVSR
jgi:hypothetical protein